ncbi:MAG: hypothetical protein HC903_01460 [Methylacidiphilales bacterium]|nr:hypothetical protein [Candidatus Methylacidiphilales bacterium]
MLKLTYTENNFNIEYIETNLQDWIENRVTFSLRTGLNGYIEHTTASFLLPSILVDKTNSTILVEQNQNIINIDCSIAILSKSLSRVFGYVLMWKVTQVFL